ncbi:hypothetical protein OCU04_008150 [Sclerotinia nivalis]|uniref:Reverse transcriptase domain-containing protein n=1 Tax=Sclerotinia nivalis TaxID=352851 RepID=A0A9X0AHG8_9HELO|nr:hypothetical protein OCU04_008150 [Sclerotinia nivalis]
MALIRSLPFQSRSIPSRKFIICTYTRYRSASSSSKIQKHVSSAPQQKSKMASTDVLSHTLSSITSIKLEEISSQRSAFEKGKADLLQAVSNEPKQSEKLRILLDRIEELASMGKLKDKRSISLYNIRIFLQQARHDPSVSEDLLKDWQEKLEKELDIHSLKYEYASLYGRLVNEWLSASEDNAASDNGYESVGRKEMHEQRQKWEDYVFKPLETDPAAIESYLTKLFTSTDDIKKAWHDLRHQTRVFEKEMENQTHFDEDSLQWVINGLLRSDLLTDEKRAILKDFRSKKIVLAEVADVLNMRMSSLDKWKWASEGTPVEQRRQINGRYRFYHDEDLLQTILLRYIGVKWSVFFNETLTRFKNSSNVWASSSPQVPKADKLKREYFLGQFHDRLGNVEATREQHFNSDIFLEQLQDSPEEQRGGYSDDDTENANDTRRSPTQITQSVLHTLATEIIMQTRFDNPVTVVRSDFTWFGPSLPHTSMFSVLSHFGVSTRWISFFRRALEAPMVFPSDGPSAPIRIRKRGTPISGPLSDMLGETVLFCLDFAMNNRTNGARLYRLHDDIWFWGSSSVCVSGWQVMQEFASLMGLSFNADKTGSCTVTRHPTIITPPPSSLPQGLVRWNFLYLDPLTGRFLIDQELVDNHIKELSLQLKACKSIFDWIQAWNIYGSRFFSTNFGRPAHCFGLAHVDDMLATFSRIQTQLFSETGGSVTSTLKSMLQSRFGVENIPEGYLYFPMSMGGLDLKSPFVPLYLIRDQVMKNPDEAMDIFFLKERADYERAKRVHENGDSTHTRSEVKHDPALESVGFPSFEEYTKYRERTSSPLHAAYDVLKSEPEECQVDVTVGREVSDTRKRHREEMSKYQKWIVQLYGSDMEERFGGLNVVEKGLLPTGMVGMFRESRFKWQG